MNSINFPTQHFFNDVYCVTVRSEPKHVNMIQINFILRGVHGFLSCTMLFLFHTLVGMEEFIRKHSLVRKGVLLTCNGSVRAHENTYFRTVQNGRESCISVVASEWKRVI